MWRSDAREDTMQKIFRTRQAAEYLGLSKSTLDKMRVQGDGPVFVRLGGRAIGYDLDDLNAWIEAQRCRSTSEPEISPDAERY